MFKDLKQEKAIRKSCFIKAITILLGIIDGEAAAWKEEIN